jgi:hypothetical protein
MQLNSTCYTKDIKNYVHIHSQDEKKKGSPSDAGMRR